MADLFPLLSAGVVTVLPDVSLRTAVRLMTPRGLRQLPVVALPAEEEVGGGEVGATPRVIGVVDRDGISLACRWGRERRREGGGGMGDGGWGDGGVGIV